MVGYLSLGEEKPNQLIESMQAKERITFTAEDVFKVSAVGVGLILSLCVKRIFEFRLYCQQNGYYAFASQSLIYCLIGFVFSWVTKYTFYYLFEDKIEKLIKYEGQLKTIKTKAVSKLFYDTLFYIATSTAAYYMFKDQSWFPFLIGGNGKCTAALQNYPQWPTDKRFELELYFTFQLGVHIFSVFELVIFKRKTDRKFYENLLHHFVAASLILGSLASNTITSGVLILIVHDFSDIFVAFGRAIIETTIAKKSFVLVPLVAAFILFPWIYMRLFVFPCCILLNVYARMPSQQDPWAMIYYPYGYILATSLVLVAMHMYWTFYIFKSLFKSITKGSLDNVHEKTSKGR